MKQFLRTSILCSLTLVGSTLVYGQAEFKPNAIANGTVNLRAAPPSWPFYRMGEDIGDIHSGQEVQLGDEKSLDFFVNKYRWYEVQVVGKDGNVVSGWAYGGKNDDPLYFDELDR